MTSKDEHTVLAIAGDYDTNGSSNKLVVFEGDGRLPVGDLDEGNVSCPDLQRRYNTFQNENLPLIQACYEGASTENLGSMILEVSLASPNLLYLFSPLSRRISRRRGRTTTIILAMGTYVYPR